MTHFCASLDAATRRKKRPSRFKPGAFDKFMSPAHYDAPCEPLVVDNAQFMKSARELLARVLHAGQRSGSPLLWGGADFIAYHTGDSFAAATGAAKLARITSAALAPATYGARDWEWGADSDARVAWRLIPSFADTLPVDVRERIADARGLALALIEHNSMDALAACADGFVSLVTAAESTGETRAGWRIAASLYLRLVAGADRRRVHHLSTSAQVARVHFTFDQDDYDARC